MERVDIKRGRRGCRTVWRSREISPSTVPKLSLASGLLYLYTKPKGTPDAWYVTAVDFHTGRTAWRRLIGTGVLFNVHYAGLAISPRGILYRRLGGTWRWRTAGPAIATDELFQDPGRYNPRGSSRLTIATITAAVGCLALGHGAALADGRVAKHPERPNVVVVMTDDQDFPPSGRCQRRDG